MGHRNFPATFHNWIRRTLTAIPPPPPELPRANRIPRVQVLLLNADKSITAAEDVLVKHYTLCDERVRLGLSPPLPWGCCRGRGTWKGAWPR